MKILLINLFDASNRGDSAIIGGMVDSIKGQYENAEFTVLTQNPDSCKLLNDLNAVRNVFGRGNKFVLIAYYILILLWKIAPHSFLGNKISNKLKLNIFLDNDLLISVGGQYF